MNPFLPYRTKLQNTLVQIHVYQDTSILHERFPKELLPTEYGGTGPSLEELDSKNS
jgi:hypothetical protein